MMYLLNWTAADTQILIHTDFPLTILGVRIRLGPGAQTL